MERPENNWLINERGNLVCNTHGCVLVVFKRDEYNYYGWCYMPDDESRKDSDVVYSEVDYKTPRDAYEALCSVFFDVKYEMSNREYTKLRRELGSIPKVRRPPIQSDCRSWFAALFK